MDWKGWLACVTGAVDEEWLRQNEYLAAENEILQIQTQIRLRLKDDERRKLAEIGKRMGGKALSEVATTVKPKTILRWHRHLIARNFGGSNARQQAGASKDGSRPGRISPSIGQGANGFLRMAKSTSRH